MAHPFTMALEREFSRMSKEAAKPAPPTAEPEPEPEYEPEPEPGPDPTEVIERVAPGALEDELAERAALDYMPNRLPVEVRSMDLNDYFNRKEAGYVSEGMAPEDARRRRDREQMAFTTPVGRFNPPTEYEGAGRQALRGVIRGVGALAGPDAGVTSVAQAFDARKQIGHEDTFGAAEERENATRRTTEGGVEAILTGDYMDVEPLPAGEPGLLGMANEMVTPAVEGATGMAAAYGAPAEAVEAQERVPEHAPLTKQRALAGTGETVVEAFADRAAVPMSADQRRQANEAYRARVAAIRAEHQGRIDALTEDLEAGRITQEESDARAAEAARERDAALEETTRAAPPSIVRELLGMAAVPFEAWSEGGTDLGKVWEAGKAGVAEHRARLGEILPDERDRFVKEVEAEKKALQAEGAKEPDSLLGRTARFVTESEPVMAVRAAARPAAQHALTGLIEERLGTEGDEAGVPLETAPAQLLRGVGQAAHGLIVSKVGRAAAEAGLSDRPLVPTSAMDRYQDEEPWYAKAARVGRFFTELSNPLELAEKNYWLDYANTVHTNRGLMDESGDMVRAFFDRDENGNYEWPRVAKGMVALGLAADFFTPSEEMVLAPAVLATRTLPRAARAANDVAAAGGTAGEVARTAAATAGVPGARTAAAKALGTTPDTHAIYGEQVLKSTKRRAAENGVVQLDPAVESQVNQYATRLGQDPVELRNGFIEENGDLIVTKGPEQRRVEAEYRAVAGEHQGSGPMTTPGRADIEGGLSVLESAARTAVDDGRAASVDDYYKSMAFRSEETWDPARATGEGMFQRESVPLTVHTGGKTAAGADRLLNNYHSGKSSVLLTDEPVSVELAVYNLAKNDPRGPREVRNIPTSTSALGIQREVQSGTGKVLLVEAIDEMPPYAVKALNDTLATMPEADRPLVFATAKAEGDYLKGAQAFPVERSLFGEIEQANPALSQLGSRGAVRGATYLDAAGKTVAEVMRTGDFGTLLHEQGHVLNLLFPGSQEERSLLLAVYGENGAFTRQSYERFAEDFSTYLRRKVIPSKRQGKPRTATARLRSIFDTIATFLSDQYALRFKGQKGGINKDVAAMLDRWQAAPPPKRTGPSGAAPTVRPDFAGPQRVDLPPVRETIPGRGHDYTRRHEALATRVPIREPFLAAELGLKKGATPTRGQLYEAILRKVLVDRARYRFPEGLTPITRHTVVPTSRVQAINRKVRENIRLATGMESKDFQRAWTEAEPWGGRIVTLPNGRKQVQIVLRGGPTGQQATGFKMLMREAKEYGLDRLSPRRLTDPAADWSFITPEELYQIAELQADIHAGPGVRRSRIVEALPVNFSEGLLRAFFGEAEWIPGGRLPEGIVRKGLRSKLYSIERVFSADDPFRRFDQIPKELVTTFRRRLQRVPDDFMARLREVDAAYHRGKAGIRELHGRSLRSFVMEEGVAGGEEGPRGMSGRSAVGATQVGTTPLGSLRSVWSTIWQGNPTLMRDLFVADAIPPVVYDAAAERAFGAIRFEPTAEGSAATTSAAQAATARVGGPNSNLKAMEDLKPVFASVQSRNEWLDDVEHVFTLSIDGIGDLERQALSHLRAGFVDNTSVSAVVKGLYERRRAILNRADEILTAVEGEIKGMITQIPIDRRLDAYKYFYNGEFDRLEIEIFGVRAMKPSDRAAYLSSILTRNKADAIQSEFLHDLWSNYVLMNTEESWAKRLARRPTHPDEQRRLDRFESHIRSLGYDDADADLLFKAWQNAVRGFDETMQTRSWRHLLYDADVEGMQRGVAKSLTNPPADTAEGALHRAAHGIVSRFKTRADAEAAIKALRDTAAARKVDEKVVLRGVVPDVADLEHYQNTVVQSAIDICTAGERGYKVAYSKMKPEDALERVEVQPGVREGTAAPRPATTVRYRPIDKSEATRVTDPMAYVEAMEFLDYYGIHPASKETFAPAVWTTPGGKEAVFPWQFAQAIDQAITESIPLASDFSSKGRLDKIAGILSGGAFGAAAGGYIAGVPGAAIGGIIGAAAGATKSDKVAITLNNMTALMKQGMTIGLGPIFHPAFLMSQWLGNLGYIYMHQGLTGVAQQGMFHVAYPDVTWEVVGAMVGGAPGKASLRSIVLPNGTIATTEMLARWARDYGLDSSMVKSDFIQSVNSDVRRYASTSRKVLDRVAIGPYRRVLLDATQAVDNAGRVGSWIHAMMQGMAPADAAVVARRIVLDYSQLSKFEKEWLRTFILFYAYQRRNIANIWYALLHDPSRAIGQIRLANGINKLVYDKDAQLIANDETAGRIAIGFKRIPRTDYAGVRWIMTPQGVPDMVAGLLAPLLSVGNPDSNVKLMQSLNPMLAMAIRRAYGTDPYLGGVPLTEPRLNVIPPFVIAYDNALFGGALRRLFNARLHTSLDGYDMIAPYSGITDVYVAEEEGALNWQDFKKMFGMFIGLSERSLSAIGAVDRADTGVVEAIPQYFARNQTYRSWLEAYYRRVNGPVFHSTQTPDAVLPWIFGEAAEGGTRGMAGPRPGIGRLGELGPVLGASMVFGPTAWTRQQETNEGINRALQEAERQGGKKLR